MMIKKIEINVYVCFIVKTKFDNETILIEGPNLARIFFSGKNV